MHASSIASLACFIKLNTIIDLNLFFQISKEWVCLYETFYEGHPVIAIPRNFPLDLLSDFTNIREYTKEKIKLDYDSRTIKIDTEPRNAEQKKMLNFLLGRGTFSNLARKPRRGMFSDTGTGKTFTSLKAISEENHFAFINCPDDKAIMTWKYEISLFTDILPEEIFVIAGASSLNKFLKSKDKYKIVLASSKTFSSLIAKNQFSEIENFFKEARFSLIIHDESHLNLSVLFYIEMITNSKRTYYLTATPGRRIFKEEKLLNNLLPSEECIYSPEIIPRFDVRICKFWSNPKSSDHLKGVIKPRGIDYLSYGKKYLFNENLPYIRFFKNSILKKVVKASRKVLSDKNNKTAIICKTKDENYLIASMIQDLFPDLTVGVFNSDIDNMDERFKQTDCQIIITTDKSMAGIVNIKKLESIIFLYPITSETHLVQIVGRERVEENKKNFIYILADYSLGTRIRKSIYSVKQILEPRSLSLLEVELNEKPTLDIHEDED